MHHIDELLRNAGFSNRTEPRSLAGLTGGSTHAQDQHDLAIGAVTRQIEQLQSLAQNSANSTSGGSQENQYSGAQPVSSNGLVSSLGNAASGVLGGSGLAGLLGGGVLGDLLSGLTDLFGGGPSQPTPLVQYVAPQSQDFELATGGGQVGDAVYNQFGSPQVAPVTEPALGGLQYLGTASNQTSDSGGTGAGSGGQSSPQITLNVQAMDSQSFLDRSADIAQAVRQAMLNMHSINDVINDL